MVSYLMDKYPEMQTKVFDRSFNKQPGGDRKRAGDGPLTGGISWYWYKNIEDKIASGELSSFDYSTNAPWLDICDYSMANHINGGGINGYIISEGRTFVGSPKWSDDYLTKSPRQ
jgi:hypothetical protein